MSKYSKGPLDFTNLKTVGLAERGGKVKTADFASPYRKGSGVAGWLDSLPHILAGDSLRSVVDALAAARGRRRAIIWGLGGHVIKCGLAPVLVDLMRRGYATAFALNGAAAIHDAFGEVVAKKVVADKIHLALENLIRRYLAERIEPLRQQWTDLAPRVRQLDPAAYAAEFGPKG